MPRVDFTDSRDSARDPSEQCSFCLRERSHLAQLICATDASICDDCVARSVRELQARRVKGWRRWWDLRPAPRAQALPSAPPYRRADVVCSFCRKANIDETIVAQHARICPPCVRLAVDVLLEALP